MADRRRPNYAIEIERLNIDNMNLEVNLRKTDFRKMEIAQELLNLDESKKSIYDLMANNKEKIAEMEKLSKGVVEETTSGKVEEKSV